MKNFIIFFYLVFIFNSNAYAYLDPGTGGFIVQLIIAFFAAAFVFINNFWQKVKFYCNKIFSFLKFKQKKDK